MGICAFIGSECDLLIKDRSKELKTGLDLSLRVFGLNDRADDRDVHVFGANVVGGRNHGNVDIWSADNKLSIGENVMTGLVPFRLPTWFWGIII